MATISWFDVITKAREKLLDWIGSDHRPLLINTTGGNGKPIASLGMRIDGRISMKSKVSSLESSASSLHLQL